MPLAIKHTQKNCVLNSKDTCGSSENDKHN